MKKGKKSQNLHFFNLVKKLNRFLKMTSFPPLESFPLPDKSNVGSHHHIFTGRNRQRQVFWSRKGESARTSTQKADADGMLLTGAWANAQPHGTLHLTDNRAWFVLPDQKYSSFYIPSTLCTEEIILKGILWAMDALQLKFDSVLCKRSGQYGEYSVHSSPVHKTTIPAHIMSS